MKTLDLHGVEKDNILFKVEKFITDNFDNLPIKVITGNSKYNVGEVTTTAIKYDLDARKAFWPHSGVWVVTNRR